MAEQDETYGQRERLRFVHERIAAHTTLRPHNAAVGSSDANLTFQQLGHCADRVAAYLRTRGLGRGHLVGIMGPRIPDTVAAMLGTLKAGCAYVPLDPSYPGDRLDDMCRDARLALVLTCTDRDYHGHLPAEQVSFARLAAGNHTEVLADCTDDDTALVVFTSGSSGRPKGVVLSHRAIAARVDAWRAHGPQCQTAPFCTVAHLGDLLCPLAHGHQVRILDDRTVRDGMAFVRAIAHHGIARIRMIPSQLAALLKQPEAVRALATVQVLVGSGEPLSQALRAAVRRSLPHVEMANAYGLTETGGMVCAGRVGDTEVVTVGRPLPTVVVHILNEERQPVEAGHKGELCVSAPFLADGYLHDPSLTAERFISAPYSATPLFRTGDLARQLPSGEIQIIGRLDNVIKVRGFRVSLEEVEQTLEEHPSVRRAAAFTDAFGVLRACIVLESAEGADVRGWLTTKLPAHAVPSELIVVGELPALPNGKLDRMAVQDHLIEVVRPTKDEKPEGHDEVEVRVRAAWSEVFERIALPIVGDFFESGGDSLMGMQIVAKLSGDFQVDLALADLFDHPTIGAVAQLLRERMSIEAPVSANALNSSNGHS